ncbi:MAG: NADH:ubiquinone oxidoreductase [Thermoplasmatales archaeon SG8-52-3]|nr:MAG: NADH:ubiquinone oxidoreductase [Thermoplasmatales archaeon SG8-52-3]
MNIIDDIILHSPALIVAIPLLGAFLTPLVSKINDKLRNIFVIFIVLFTSAIVLLLANDIYLVCGKIHTYVFGGNAPITEGGFAIRILFEVDGLNIFMALIATILAIAGVIYSWAFMKENTGLDKYYTLYLLMIAGMYGMILTGDMFNFFVFLEITSIASCALIAFWTNKGKAIDAGFKYIVVSATGALFVLFAIAILYGQYNALNMAVLASKIQFSFLDKIALVILISGLAMKAGIVPMHMWLPDAYGRAPASVTLILVGVTQASLYGALRMIFTLYGGKLTTTMNQIGDVSIDLNLVLGIFIVGLALLTIFIGVLMALKENNFKRMIAFAAVAEIGYMILAIGAALTTVFSTNDAGTGMMALKGGVFHILNDALDVGLLFLVAGAIYYATKETSLNQLGGLARNMKYTTIFFLIGLLAVSGMPPMNGFASKLIIYESTYQVNPILSIIAILCSILLLAVFVKVFHSAFLGPKLPKFDNVKEVPKSMLLAMGIIATIIIFIGLFPDMVVNYIVQPAVNALTNNSNYISNVIGGI